MDGITNQDIIMHLNALKIPDSIAVFEGQPLTVEVRQRIESLHQGKVRFLGQGEMGTMERSMGRLNVYTDASGTIVRITRG